MILKKQVFYKFYPPIFLCISRLFLWHPDIFCRKTNKFAQTPKQLNKYNFFKKKITFPQKMLLDARIAVVTTREKNYRSSVFRIKIQRSVKDHINFKRFFPLKLPRIRRLRVSQLWQKFSLEVNNCSESEKNREFFSFKKISMNRSRGHIMLYCQPLKKLSAIVPKTSKIIQKSSSFQDFHSEMLLCNCSIGHVKSIYDNPAKNFPAKTQVFLVKIQKKHEKPIVQQIFWRFFLCTLRLLFQHTWLVFFLKSKKTHSKSQKRW